MEHAEIDGWQRSKRGMHCVKGRQCKEGEQCEQVSSHGMQQSMHAMHAEQAWQEGHASKASMQGASKHDQITRNETH